MTEKRSDLADVEQKLHQLAAEGRIDDLIAMVIDLLARVQRDNTALAARLHTALRQLYGRRSEQVSADQLSLVFEALGEAAPQSAQDVVKDAVAADADGAVKQPDDKPRAAGHRGGKRNPLPESLPRRRRVIRVPEELRHCPCCGADKESMGSVTTEILEFIPAQFVVVVEEREKLTCRACGKGVVIAETTKPMERGRPGAGLLAAIVVSKGQDSQPLYRQCQIYQRGLLQISDSTLGDWFAFAADVLESIAKRLRAIALGSLLLGADDTGLPVQEKNNPKPKTKRGHLWAYVAYRDDGSLVVFDYTPTWEAKGPRKFLARYRGMLQGDGYAGYNQALTREDGEALVAEERRLGCGMHIRRRFEAAADSGDKRGAIALAYFRKLYAIERACKSDGLSHEDRHRRRQTESIPVLNELYKWIHELHAKLIPGDKLEGATKYAVNQEEFFRRCFEDGRYEIDNGEVERQLRRVALGRKNFLFAGSDRAAERLAVIYTILGTCHMHGVEPLSYIADVIDKLQNKWPLARIDELLPHRWQRPERLYWQDLEQLDPVPATATSAAS